MFPESRVFINASGLGSKTLTDVQDDQCFPERGQNVFLATENCQTLYFRNGQQYTYVIPRPMSQGVVLGGVKQHDDLSASSRPSIVPSSPSFSSPDVDMDIARDEIARAHILAPEIVPKDPAPETVSHIIGIRPSRKGGFRLDSERIDQRVVISAYGFGGGGYAFSYGVADAVAKMVEKTERDNVI
jgi:D-amino-acid oxidase